VLEFSTSQLRFSESLESELFKKAACSSHDDSRLRLKPHDSRFRLTSGITSVAKSSIERSSFLWDMLEKFGRKIRQ